VTAVLVIAGTDSSGGAGLTRDVATLTHFGVEALCAVTAVTAQSETAVVSVERLPAAAVREQIATALATGRVAAIKTGMLAGSDIVEAVAATIPPRERVPLVVDPVLAATSGGALLDDAGREALRTRLLARATLLTPNLMEAAALLGAAVASSEQEVVAQGRALCALGATAVLMKGGHAGGALASDWLVAADGRVRQLTVARVAARRRGTGCALAAAIAAGLATGLAIDAACTQAKTHVTELLQQTRRQQATT
jgi:hydroxymethylpyrimidine/phosphomethylpyrimidine kinase